MVDADAGVALERVPPIVPEGVDPLVGMERAERVGPALRRPARRTSSAPPARRARPWPSAPACRRPARSGMTLKSPISIAGSPLSSRCRAWACKPVHPGELVIELRPRPRIAVGQIEVADQQAADRRLDVAALHVLGIAGQAAAGFDRLADAAEDGDSVPAAAAHARWPNSRAPRCPWPGTPRRCISAPAGRRRPAGTPPASAAARAGAG